MRLVIRPAVVEFHHNLVFVYLHDTPHDDPAVRCLERKLVYKHVQALRGMELIQAAREDKPKVKITNYPLLVRDAESNPVRFVAYAGLAERICDELRELAFEVKIAIADDLKWQKPNLVRVQEIDANPETKLRGKQWEALEAMCKYRRCQINAGTGFGKTFMMGVLCAAYDSPDTKILICSPSVNLMRDAHARVSAMTKEFVGMLGDSENTIRRITSCTVGSMLAYPDLSKVDIFIQDEVHAVGTLNKQECLRHVWRARMIGLSASVNKRTDGGNILIEAMFGKQKVAVPFSECLAAGYVPPVKATFYTFPVANLSEAYLSSDAKKRNLIWRSRSWNDALVRVARHYADLPSKPQILIIVATVEHMLFLQSRGLSDFSVVYGLEDMARVAKLENRKALPADFVPMTKKESERRLAAFKAGEIRLLIGHTGLGVGLDVPSLDVVIRGDGGVADISNAQFRGRVTRGDGGHYVDLIPVGDPWLEKRGLTRYDSCRKDGWEMHKEDIRDIDSVSVGGLG